MSRTTFSGTTVTCEFVSYPSEMTCGKTLTLAGEDTPENHGWGTLSTLRDNCIWEPHDLCPSHYANIVRQLGVEK
jgi:hypothetical protein